MRNFLMFLALLMATGVWGQDWYHVGPTSTATSQFFSERVQYIAANPFNTDSMYCSSKGGLWISGNSGNSWTEMDPHNHMPIYSGATSIAVGPSSHHVYVASTDIDNGISDSRIWVYNNSTSSWSALTSIASGSFLIHNIKFYPGNENTIYACTSIGLYRSINRGVTWTYDPNVTTTPTEVYDIIFAKLGTTTYSYISGFKMFEKATDGYMFTATTLPAFASSGGLFSSFAYTMADMCVGNVTSTSFDIYYGAACYNTSSVSGSDPAATYQIYKYTNNGTESANIYAYEPNYDNNQDRIEIGYASNGILFWGGVTEVCYDTKNGDMSVYANIDNYSGSTVYHNDHHCLLDVPTDSGRGTVYEANDGGLYHWNYSGYDHTNSATYPLFTTSNIGLDIAQMNAFSGAGSDTTLYVSGEQDRWGKVYDFSTPSEVVYPGYWENEGGLVDQFDNDTVIINPIEGGEYMVSGDGGNTFPAGQQCTDEPVSSTNIAPGSSDCELSDWADNSYFQDPSRPGKMYFGTNYINQLSEGTYVVKMRPFAAFNKPWTAAGVRGGAISPIYKNAFYCYTGSRNYTAPDTVSSYVIKFIGPDIDDCWAGRNEDNAHWQQIYPNYKGVYAGAPWSYTFTGNDLVKITLTGIAVSTWNPNKIWVSVSPTAKYPGVKAMQYDGTNWTDYSTGIPANEVANSIVMEIGTNDGMYLGTNRAVYYRNANMTSWTLFNDGALPEVIMSQLEINYYENKLRVGTFGRGIWESSFECPTGASHTYTTATTNEFDEWQQYINSTANVASASTVYYRAGEYVSLNQGFYANSGSQFFAFIHPCNSPGNSSIRRADGSVTDVEDVEKVINNVGYQIDVYPNPNRGDFTINLPADEVSDIHVYNLLGNEIYSETGVKDKVEINLSNLPKGIYFVKAINKETNETDSKKVIVQ